MSLAATAYNATLAPSASYTVGAGKTFIFSARLAAAESGVNTQMLINGNVACVFLVNNVQPEYKPFTANAGDVISNYSGSANGIAISGLLY
jgi:hypothetical protein